MRRVNVVLLLTMLTVISANAEAESEFSFECEDFAGVNLNYRMAIINPEVQSPEIIIMYLHGGSGQGSDNSAQLESQAVEDIYNYLSQSGRHARLLAPQAPDGYQWEDELLPALKALADKYNIAGQSECYILGGSMGGYGVWNMLTDYPDYFTGAMPVACNTPKAPAQNYAGPRICSVVGGNDPQRNIDAIQTFFHRLEAADAKGAKLDIEYDWNHRETCEWSFTSQRLDWLFLSGESSISAVYADLSEFQSGLYDTNGYRISDPVPGHIYICCGKKFVY